AHSRRGLDACDVPWPAARVGVERLLPWALLPSADDPARRDGHAAGSRAASGQRVICPGGPALLAREARGLRAGAGAGWMCARGFELREWRALERAGEAGNGLRLPPGEQPASWKAGCTVPAGARGRATDAATRMGALALLLQPALAEAAARDLGRAGDAGRAVPAPLLPGHERQGIAARGDPGALPAARHERSTLRGVQESPGAEALVHEARASGLRRCLESERQHLPAVLARRWLAARLALAHQAQAVVGRNESAEARSRPALDRRCRHARDDQCATRARAHRRLGLEALVLDTGAHGPPEACHLSR